MKKRNWKSYVFWIIFTEVIGGLSGWLTRKGMELYRTAIIKPPLSPPGIVFPIVWSILFALMGVRATRISLSPASNDRSRALGIFLLQLAFKAIPHNIGRGRKQGTTKLLPPLAYSDMCGRQPD